MPATLPARLFALAFVVLAAAIMWFSLAPMTAPPGGGHIDKLEHFGAYTALALTGFAARGRPWRLLALGVIAFGGTVEVLQALMPTGRTGSVLDAAANTAGVAFAWGGWRAAERIRRR